MRRRPGARVGVGRVQCRGLGQHRRSHSRTEVTPRPAGGRDRARGLGLGHVPRPRDPLHRLGSRRRRPRPRRRSGPRALRWASRRCGCGSRAAARRTARRRRQSRVQNQQWVGRADTCASSAASISVSCASSSSMGALNQMDSVDLPAPGGLRRVLWQVAGGGVQQQYRGRKRGANAKRMVGRAAHARGRPGMISTALQATGGV